MRVYAITPDPKRLDLAIEACPVSSYTAEDAHQRASRLGKRLKKTFFVVECELKRSVK